MSYYWLDDAGTAFIQFEDPSLDPGTGWHSATADEFNQFVAEYYKSLGFFGILSTRSVVRHNAVALQDNTLDDGRGYAVFIEDRPEFGITQIAFDLDGSPHNTEFSAPWDFNGTAVGGEAIKYVFSAGTHEIDAHITYAGGQTIVLTSTFEVD